MSIRGEDEALARAWARAWAVMCEETLREQREQHEAFIAEVQAMEAEDLPDEDFVMNKRHPNRGTDQA